VTWEQGLIFSAFVVGVALLGWFLFRNPPDIHNDQGPGDGWPGPQ
jgi:hypothetical protein